MQQANKTSIALIHSLRHSSTHQIALLAHKISSACSSFPPSLFVECFSRYRALLLHPSWQDAHVVSPGTAPSHQILPSTAAIGLPAQSLHLLILQTKFLIYAYTFPQWIPTLLSLPTNWQEPSFIFLTCFISSQNSAYWHLSHCKT